MSGSQNSTKLSDWLSWTARPNSTYHGFDLFDVAEKCDVNETIKQYLIKLVLNASYDLDLLKDMIQTLGWTEANNYIISQHNLERVDRGDFGEILGGALLEEFCGYTIPVQKLRYKPTRSQTLTGTDLIVIKIENRIITELCYVEAKCHTSSNHSAVVDGYKKLVEDYKLETPEALIFVAARLREKKDPEYSSFKKFMQDRKDNQNAETFHLGLIWDVSTWNEKALGDLQDEVDPKLPKLSVHFTPIKNLKSLTDEVFKGGGLEAIDVE